MDQRIQLVTALMKEDICLDRSFTELARAVNLSPSRLRHLFKLEVGLSPAQYIRVLRMQKAKELLESTFLNIKEIMNMVGIKDNSHFNKNFKDMFGLTPSQCRARHSRDDVSKTLVLNK
jgi:transcriptional regulator GlxA family with amidase domain